MEFRILGPLEVRSDAGAVALGGIKARALLAMLLLHANEPVSADRLAAALWGEEAPHGAVKTVQVHVSRLRRALGDAEMVVTTPAGYRLRVRPGELDAERFELLVEDGRRALAAGQSERAAAVLHEALNLWRGPALADLAIEPFAQAEIARLEEQRVAALEARVEADLAAGRHAALVGELQQLVASYPTRERLAGQLMLTLYRCGRQAEALEAYQGARRVLVAEIGVEPGPELRRLQDAILRQDLSLEPAAAVADLPRELDAATAPALVGRDAELAWLRARCERARSGAGSLVTMLGTRGIGKSRLAAELAGEVHRLGATVLYGAGAGPSDAVLVALDRAREATQPTLLVIDDADEAGADVLAELEKSSPVLAGAPVLTLVSGKDAQVLARLSAGGGGGLGLEPLDAEAVGAIAMTYAPTDGRGEEVPAEWLFEASGGLPRRVHEVASQWARREAARRVSAVAGRAADGRAELRSMETELAGGVAELQRARERVALVRDDDAPVVCPFKGLASFQVADAQFFCGRERLVAELVARLVGAPLLGVVGPSGSGKSSVLRAGLLPALAGGVLPGSESWEQVLIRPGEHPLGELREAAGDRRVVLAVDQFEETFTACRDEHERSEFIAELVRAARDRDARRIVVLAVRADFYGRCAAFPELSGLLAAAHVLVRPMRRDELRQAIERPAERAGLLVEPELADALVTDVQDEPGALPLLSSALLELWQRRDGRRLRLAAYEHTGGVRGAVARLAEEAYGQLDPAQQIVARGALLRLAGEGSAGTAVPRRVPLAELQTPHSDNLARVLALLTDRRLLTINAGTVEVAHAALLREWPRLRGWLQDDADGRRRHHHLTDTARDWNDRGRDPGDLYRGARLASALEWRTQHQHGLNQTERSFLDASQAAEHNLLDASRRRTRRLRVLSAILVMLLVLVGTVGGLAVQQRQVARQRGDLAAARQLAAEAAVHVDQQPLSLLLSLESLRLAPTNEARARLLRGVLEPRHNVLALTGHTGHVYGVAFSPDSKVMVSGSDDRTVRRWSAATGAPIGQPLTGHTDWVRAVAFSPDGTTIVSASNDRTLRRWDAATGAPVGQPLTGHTDWVRAVAFSPDGRTIVSGSSDKTLRLWDGRTGGPIGQPLIGHTDKVWAVAFSPDGTMIASASDDGTVRRWNAATGQPLGQPATGHTGAVLSVAFSPDSRTIVSAGADRTIRRWNAATGAPIGQSLTGHTDQVLAVAVSPDGAVIASASDDGTVRRWNAANGRPLGQPWTGHTNVVYAVAFSPDGTMLASASSDRTVRRWDAVRGPLIGPTLTGYPDQVVRVAFSPDGKMIASAGQDRTVRRWNAATGDPIGGPLTGHLDEVLAVAFSPDGTMLASASEDHTVRRWNAATGDPIGGPLKGHTDQVVRVAFSPDGKTIVSAGQDRTVRRWNAATGDPIGQPLTGHTDHVLAVAVSPDGAMIASAGRDGTVRRWNATTGDPIGGPLKGHTDQVLAVAFSPDGTMIASAGRDRTVRRWNATTGAPIGQPLTGHTDQVVRVAFNRDGTSIVSAEEDGTVRRWNATTGAPIGQPLTDYIDHVGTVMLSSDGARLATASIDHKLRVFPTDAETWIRHACTLAKRNLTHDEWEEFIGSDRPYHRTCPDLPAG